MNFSGPHARPIWTALAVAVTVLSAIPVFLLPPPIPKSTGLAPVYTQLSFGDWNDSYPAANPLTQKIAFVSQHSDGSYLLLMDSDGRHSVILAHFTSGGLGPLEFSPDGREVAFLFNSIQNHSTSIMAVGVQSGTTVRLGPDEAGVIGTFHWSPDGMHLVFDLNQSGRWSIRSLDVETGVEEVLLPNGANGSADFRDPSWCPDGGSIVFASDLGGTSYNIWAMNLSTGELDRLTHGTGDSTRPSVSPNGLYVAYVSTERTGSSAIWIVDRNGANAHLAFSYPLDQNPGIGWVPAVPPGSYPIWNSLSQGVMFYSNGSAMANVFVYYANITVSVYRHVAPTIQMTGSSIVPMVFVQSATESAWGTSDQQIVYSASDSSGYYHIWTRLLSETIPKPSYGSR